MRADILERRCAEMRARFAGERAERLSHSLQIRGKSVAEITAKLAQFWEGVRADRRRVESARK